MACVHGPRLRGGGTTSIWQSGAVQPATRRSQPADFRTTTDPVPSLFDAGGLADYPGCFFFFFFGVVWNQNTTDRPVTMAFRVRPERETNQGARSLNYSGAHLLTRPPGLTAHPHVLVGRTLSAHIGSGPAPRDRAAESVRSGHKRHYKSFSNHYDLGTCLSRLFNHIPQRTRRSLVQVTLTQAKPYSRRDAAGLVMFKRQKYEWVFTTYLEEETLGDMRSRD